jgi:hypothetical protein
MIHPHEDCFNRNRLEGLQQMNCARGATLCARYEESGSDSEA